MLLGVRKRLGGGGLCGNCRTGNPRAATRIFFPGVHEYILFMFQTGSDTLMIGAVAAIVHRQEWWRGGIGRFVNGWTAVIAFIFVFHLVSNDDQIFEGHLFTYSRNYP